MSELHDSYSEFTLHIVLATIPQKQESEFDEGVKRDFYDKYRREAGKYYSQDAKELEQYWYHQNDLNTPVLYNPIRYYILGNYDIAYISLIDNFKFAQRLFEPQLSLENQPDFFYPHTFQSFTGITYSSAESQKSFFYDKLKDKNPTRKYFLGICNLKLNNGILIGNGRRYTNSVVQAINDVINKKNKDENRQIEHMIVQSFSWFEISLLLFTDRPDDISELMRSLRRLSIEQIPDAEQIISDSFYRSLHPKDEDLKLLKQANVFADTHTYIGIHSELVTGKLESAYVQEFITKDINLSTAVEWQVKPGHMHLLTALLEQMKTDKGSAIFDLKEKLLLAGKSDYMLEHMSKKVNNNIFLMRHILDKNCKLFDHVRKIKTRLFFSFPVQKGPPREVNNLHGGLQGLAFKLEKIHDIDSQLKALKVSRQIRSKILKIFSNYNNGIQDIILFPFFLDFRTFMESLQEVIEFEYNSWLGRFEDGEYCFTDQTVNELEKRMEELIKIFQEAYNIRMLNCYQFEDINDFDLDFNSSIQQLLSVYSTIAFETGNLFYLPEYKYGPIVQLNLKDTVSNYISINYHVQHLTSPEFVFATLTKEILNFLNIDNEEYQGLLDRYEKIKPQLKEENGILGEMIGGRLIDLNYYFNDAIRYFVTYNGQFKLFNFWFWTYNFQNSSLYDRSGPINENHFRKEMFRIIFIYKLFGDSSEPLSCPLPEMFTYWDRHYNSLIDACESFNLILRRENLMQTFITILVKMVDKANEVGQADCVIPTGDIDEAYKKIDAVLESSGVWPNISRGFLNRFAKKEYAFNNIECLGKNEENFHIPMGSQLFLQLYMYRYLNTIYELNHKKVSLIRRNWEDGKPLLSFVLSNQQPHMYSVDQSGGLFFDDTVQLNKYFKLSSMTLLELWSYAFIRKKNFVLKKLGIN